MSRRVAVTGMGLVSPLGIGRECFAEALFGGVGGIGPIENFDAEVFKSKCAAEVRDFSAKDFISPRLLRRMDRLSQMVAASARMAIEDAGVDLASSDRDRMGIVMGTAFGATDVASRFAGTLFTEGPRRVNPILVPNTVMNAPAGHTAIELGLRGINTTLNHREGSAETAIACAAMQIREGRADMILTGGGDILSPFFFSVLERFRALSPQNNGEEAARPFDRRRNGPVAGESVGVLCLEPLESARARGATVYCEIAGWGMSGAPAPANDWPDNPDGMLRAMQAAMAMAGVDPESIDAVSAAASGGVRSDRLEALALERCFTGTRQPVVTSIKGALGENFASGGIRTAAMALGIHSGKVPPTLGLTEPITPLAMVSADSREMSVGYGLVNACASGGTCVSLLLKKP
ncbi:3-oxoacyl-[acyl-carrier-protein] synthase 2 [Desulfosarcina widdelii]|uniref:3-oxoacyl-[acyl-carrier-protein] synthase 2 n=1 Tax=Desulfosarcina widdelii TaxID=947919 RepID=A0A5K7Z7P7_9BACT|nr:beta-ketoacyl-[acyl-carrier-protein] synthase family protein [Desulfosarcina widdelii]BBO75883.1 3-oxoacyl-[acyl-carrier-protein] synthase 2 [Desulfosarcina widdelii]